MKSVIIVQLFVIDNVVVTIETGMPVLSKHPPP